MMAFYCIFRDTYNISISLGDPIYAAEILKEELGVRILGIGIGEQSMTTRAINELSRIVSRPIDGQRVDYWHVRSFHKLDQIVNDISNEVCREARNNGNGGVSTEPGYLLCNATKLYNRQIIGGGDGIIINMYF